MLMVISAVYKRNDRAKDDQCCSFRDSERGLGEVQTGE